MAETTRLELGLVRTDALMDEVLMEILDHLGIVYREAGEGDFPLLISSTKPREASFSKSLLVAEDVLPMDEVLNALSGSSSVEDRDCFDLRINELEDRLLAHLRNLYLAEGLPLVRKWYWPNFSKACVVLTHDVDWLSYSPFHKVVYRNNSFPKFLKLVFKHLFLREDYGYNIPEMIEIEKSRGFKSTFFLKTNYDDLEKARRVQESLKEKGFEIGLHAARDSHKVLDMLKEEIASLQEATGSEIYGVRYHRLKFKPGLTWRLEEEAGLGYDSTFSNNKYFGFKSQLCYPFHPVDPLLKRRLNILEIPMAFMDWASLHRQYTYDDCQSVMRRLMDAVIKYHGCFAINFHNTYLSKDVFQQVYKLFLWSLDEAIVRSFWVTNGFECYNWWSMRACVKLKLEFDRNIISGESSLRKFPLIIEMAEVKEALPFIADSVFKIDMDA
ncbi:MAG: hypothetical protein FGF50_10835 [Candidatus Brockarchaeota archaeon]|nr:hypothetical protein [Candidatus Brockarchaeota archaeon]